MSAATSSPHGDEPGLASPLCDATMLAAASRLSIPTLLAVAGPGCDAELTPAEVLQRASELARSGALAGTFSVTHTVANELERAAMVVPTEASLQIVRCARERRAWSRSAAAGARWN